MGSFEGMYYKHQKGGRTVSLIAGRAEDHAFIQVITNRESYIFRYPLSSYSKKNHLEIAGNTFSNSGIKIDINESRAVMRGEIKYTRLTPLRYDIMGPFKYLKMQCRHTIESLHHRLEGSLSINGEVTDFTGGTGYIEGDCGTSFPKSYAWVHCNDFSEKACVTVSVADIPFMGRHFRGCIGVVYLRGTEYRMATYTGVKIVRCDENQIILKQGGLRLEIEIGAGPGHMLLAPQNGKMIREIRERIVCGAKIRFIKDGKTQLDSCCENASFEYLK